MIDYNELEKYDKNKTKILKYVLYKKRTEIEIRRKFQDEIEADMLDNIIEELKEKEYISDNQYIERAINEYIALKNMSIKQIKYKLQSKGISNNLIEDYLYENREQMKEYEIKSIDKIISKNSDASEEEIIQNLLKKGFEYDNVKEAIERRG